MKLLRLVLQYRIQLILIIVFFLIFSKLYQRRQLLYLHEDWQNYEAKRGFDIQHNDSNEAKRGFDIQHNHSNQENRDSNLFRSDTEHYFLLVLILSNSVKTRAVSRNNWNNEEYHRSHDLSLKILYIVGEDQLNNSVESDLIKTNITERKPNLVRKVREGLKIALQQFSFEYVLKTDIDVYHNYTRWVERLRESSRENGKPVLYGGCSCGRHVNVEFPYCAGMGYVLHHTAAAHVAHYPEEKMERAEDRNVGKVMWEWRMKRSLEGGGKLELRLNECREGIFGRKVAIHAGYHLRSPEKLKECWDRIGLGYG